MKKMRDKLHVFEPVDIQWAEEHPKCAHMLKYAGWFTFFENIIGYNIEFSREIAKSFTGTRVDFSSISFEVS